MIIAAGISQSRNRFQFTRQAGWPYWTLSLQIRGDNIKQTEQQKITRYAPYFALTKPNVKYQVTSLPGQRHYFEYYAIFRPHPEWTRLLEWTQEPTGTFYMHLAPKETVLPLKRAFEDLLIFRRNIHPESVELAENALERILLLLQQFHADHPTKIPDDRIKNTIEYLNKNLSKQLSVHDLAQHAHISPSRFAHIFADSTGMAPMHYLELQRIESAKALLLLTSDTIYMIAEKVGFQNQYHFSTRFRLLTGVSPRRFRQKAHTYN